MNKIKIKLIDNTELKDGTDGTFSNGYTQYKKLVRPNQGIDIETGDTIHFFDYGLVEANGYHFIDKKDIFLRSGFIQKKGSVAIRKNITKKENGFILGEEEFFNIIDSNVSSIKDNELVIVNSKTSYLFNYNNTPMVFIYPQHVFLILDPVTQKIKAGPDFMMLKPLVKKHLIVKDIKENSGIFEGKEYFFESASYDIKIKNNHFRIVNKNDIKLIK